MPAVDLRAGEGCHIRSVNCMWRSGGRVPINDADRRQDVTFTVFWRCTARNQLPMVRLTSRPGRAAGISPRVVAGWRWGAVQGACRGLEGQPRERNSLMVARSQFLRFYPVPRRVVQQNNAPIAVPRRMRRKTVRGEQIVSNRPDIPSTSFSPVFRRTLPRCGLVQSMRRPHVRRA